MRIERPSSEVELIDAVARAVADGLTVRVAGAGHSFTDAACTDGVMISLDSMDEVVAVDREHGLVEVQAGIRLAALGERLADEGLAMENLGDIAVQALAGAVSTATHGTGLRFQNLSAQVHALRIVTASGDVVVVSADDEDQERFRAARVAIGSLGAISTVTLKCVPTYTLRRVDEPKPLDDVLASLDDYVEAHEHWEFFTFPYTGVAFTRLSERTDDPPKPPSRLKRLLKDTIAENLVLGVICRLGRIFPRWVPKLNRALPKVASREERVDRGDRVFANDRLVKFTEMEYAVPREHGAEAVRRILEFVESRRLPITFPLEVRFAPPDDALLGPSFGRESCYVAVHVYRGTEYEEYFRGVEAIMSEYGGRPHWGKRHFLTDHELSDRYPEWDAFQAVRARMDPDGVFANEYTQRVLGYVRAGERSGTTRSGGRA